MLSQLDLVSNADERATRAVGRGRPPAAPPPDGRPGHDRAPRWPRERRRSSSSARAATSACDPTPAGCSRSSTNRAASPSARSATGRRTGATRPSGRPAGRCYPSSRAAASQARRPGRRSTPPAGSATHRYFHAFPSVDNAPSNAICRKLGFELLGACDFEFPTRPPDALQRLAPRPVRRRLSLVRFAGAHLCGLRPREPRRRQVLQRLRRSPRRAGRGRARVPQDRHGRSSATSSGSTALGERLDPEALRARDAPLLRRDARRSSSATAARSRSSSATR